MVSGVERIVSKVESALTQHAAHHERMAEKVAAKAERQQDVARKLAAKAEQLGSFQVWTRRRGHQRGPRFTLEQLAEAAIRIADKEGFSALSMRHLAGELGAGTMTLYHYVKTKDELLALVMDTVMGEVVLGPDQVMPKNWREALTLVAQRTRNALLRHPWWIEIVDDPHFGPNTMLHFDQTLQAVSSLDISLAEKLEITSAVDEYVFGNCLQDREAPGEFDDPPDELRAYIEDLMASGDYPELGALSEKLGLDGLWEEMSVAIRTDGRFERNLNRLLDGIEAGLR